MIRCLFFLWALLLTASQGLADDMRPASLSIEQQAGNEFLVNWKVPAQGNQRVALDVIFDDSTIAISQPITQFSNAAYLTQWRIRRDDGLDGLSLRIDGLVSSSADVLLRIIDNKQQVITAVLNVDQPNFAVQSSAQARASNTLMAYILLGIEHILVGLDHLLFVACLVYLCRSWRKLLWTITGFTLAHSVTLIMAATGVVAIPIPPVEAVIALSIVFLALEIAKQRENSLTFRYPVAVSSSFGLLHGFGFASVLTDIGLPENEKITALLSFNIGVEIGQLLFVAVLFASFYVAKRLWPGLSVDALRYFVSYSCGSLATYWLMQRLLTF